LLIKLFILIVIDPRHKLQYYTDNEFEEDYIIAYKNQIKELWVTKYKPENNENDNQNINQNSLAAHMFKKRKTSYSDELEAYLNEPPANFDMDILAFWKVNNKYMILFIISVIWKFISNIKFLIFYRFMKINFQICQKWLEIF
jgi:hypothetical protein